MKKNKNNKKTNQKDPNTWRSIHNLFMTKASTESTPRFLPSGRLKAPTKLDYRAVIEQAARSMIRFKKPERLIRMIVRIIAEQIKVTHTGVLLYKGVKKSYELIDSKGEEGKRIPVGYIRIPAHNPLINLFMEKRTFLLDQRSVLVYENLEKLSRDKDLLKKEKRLRDQVGQIKKEMDLLRASICIPAYFKKKLLGILVLGNKISGKAFDDEEIGTFTALASDVAMAITVTQRTEDLREKVKEITTLYEREHRLFIHFIISLATAIDAKDTYTHGHTERVTNYALAIADELTQRPELVDYVRFKERLRIASLLHDIGKIGIPDNILHKEKELTDLEFKEVKKHPGVGAAILKSVRELGDVVEVVRTHQERYDGTGYPGGLKGKEIPLMSRIIAVADTFDAITTKRPYRDKKCNEDALKEIKRHSGTQFDPVVVTAFIAAYKKGKLSSPRT